MNSLVNDSVFNVGCDMLIVPISTGGSISSSFLSGFENSKIKLRPKKKNYKLGEIEDHKIKDHSSAKFVVFACSVDAQSSNYSAISTLGKKVGVFSKKFRNVKSIGMPLLGTGAGGMDATESITALFNSFYSVSRVDIDLIFCVNDNKIFTSLKKRFYTDEGVSLFRVKELILSNKKTRRKRLDLGNCGITDLSVFPELFDCFHLEELILSNEWGQYDFGHWVRKESSNKGFANSIRSLPTELSNLKNLRILICGGDWNNSKKSRVLQTKWGIKDISAVSGLINLIILNVSNNELEKLDGITNLLSLEKLYLNNNKISSLPNLSGLKSLKELYLSNNNLSNVDFLNNLTSIKTLDLHSNNISDLTPLKGVLSLIGIKDSKWAMNTISISPSFLKIPTPEIISQGKEKIIAYFNQLEAEESINLKPFINQDIKLILVGNSNVGKSTLLHWLKYKTVKKDIHTTHWMVVDKWQSNYKGKDYTIRIFDFGGQEYYHDTHHLFFTNKTAYVLLWEEKTDRFDEIEVEQMQGDGTMQKLKIQTFPLAYWLESINFHTKRKKKTESEKEIELLLDERDKSINQAVRDVGDIVKPVYSSIESLDRVLQDDESILIVQNKVDSIKEKIFIDQNALKESNNKIFDFETISVWNEKGLNVFEDTLFQVFDSMPMIGKEYLGTWGFIKYKIENQKFNKPYSLAEFKNYCNGIIKKIPVVSGKSDIQINKVIFSNQDAQSFAQYLNDIGVLLYFPENGKLKNKIFLNQDQVLRNIYDVLLGLDVAHGRFDVNHVTASLKKKNMDEDVSNTINLMLHFKIIFQHPAKEDTYIAPLYLPKEPIGSIKIFTPLFRKPVYRYEYKKFIYKNVILGFFNRYGKKAMNEADGIDHYYYWKQGIVLRDEITGEIIMVKFSPASKEEQFAFIDVYKISGSSSEVFLNQIIQDLDTINEDWEATKTVTANGEDFIPLTVIHENERDENWVFLHGKKYYKLADFKKYFLKPIKMKKIFISYSKQDLSLVNKFIEHLSALQLDGKVSHWYCSELEPGSEWDKEIQKHLDEADIACFMISPNFMKTSYIHEQEISKAFEKKLTLPNFKIVPIILDFCRWTTTKNNLGTFTALPYTAKPVADFANENMAWYIIEECLRLIIDNDLDATGDDFYSKQKLPPDVLKIYKRIVEDKVDKNSR